MAAFLDGRIAWRAIADVVEGTLDRYDAVDAGWRPGARPARSRTCSTPTPPPAGWPTRPCAGREAAA